MIWDEQSLQQAGKQSRLPEGYSRLYRGATGSIHDRRFQVLGRARYRFEHGFWDEWYVVFSNGDDAWITESDYQFSLQQQTDPSAFQMRPNIALGDTISIHSQDFQVQEVGHAYCTGIEGDLPKEIRLSDQYMYLNACSFDGKSSLGIEFHDPHHLYIGTWLESSHILLDDESLEW